MVYMEKNKRFLKTFSSKLTEILIDKNVFKWNILKVPIFQCNKYKFSYNASGRFLRALLYNIGIDEKSITFLNVSPR